MLREMIGFAAQRLMELEPVERRDNSILPGQWGGQHLVVAVDEGGDAALGNGHTTAERQGERLPPASGR